MQIGHKSNRKPQNTSALPAEYGSVFNIRILTSSEAPISRGTSKNGNDVYYNTVLGKQAITHINQDGYSMNLIKMLGEDKLSLIDLETAA